MEIELRGTIRGEDVRVIWSDGELKGDPGLIKRVRMLQETRDADLSDYTKAIHALERAAAQRLHMTVIDPTPSPPTGRYLLGESA